MTEELVRRRLFREVNERIRDVNLRFGTVSPEYQVLCECGRPACVERVYTPAGVYEELRLSAGVFLVAPGHVRAGSERVLAETAEYVVVAAGGAAVAA